jgi:hypothetical protein
LAKLDPFGEALLMQLALRVLSNGNRGGLQRAPAASPSERQ